MIKFEEGMLVTDATVSKEDVEAIYKFVKKQTDDTVSLIKQRLAQAYHSYPKTYGADYFWSMQEVLGIIDGRYENVYPVYYDKEYKGDVPEGAILLDGN